MLSKSLCGFGSHCVGIGVEHIAPAVVCERCDDRYKTLCYEPGKHLAVGMVNISGKAVIDLSCRAFVCRYYIAVGSCKPQCIHSACLQLCNYVLVHQSAIHHCNHLQHILIGDAPSVYHTALYAQPCSHGSSRPPAAMYQHLIASDSCKTVEKIAQRTTLLDNLPSNLYNGDFLFHQ